MKWNELYESEEQLIEDMMKTKSDPDKYPIHQLVKGYGYIESFKKYYQKHGQLTEKQMTQLKRLAVSIYSNLYKNNFRFTL